MTNTPTSTPRDSVARANRLDRVLNWIERVGNRLPEPFILFVLLTLIVAVVSTLMAGFGVSILIPGDEESTPIRGAFTGAGVEFMFTGLASNFIEFPPLQTVVTIMLGVGLAERTGLLAALIRLAFGNAPKWLLPYALGFIGVTGSVMSDSAFIIIPPLAAMVFKAAGRHPVAGLLGGFAAAGAGYSTSLLVTSLDALFSGITNSVVETLPGIGATASSVTPVSNYFFNIASAIVLSLIAGFIIAKVVEPGLVRSDFPREEVDAPAAAGGRGGPAPRTVEDAEAADIAESEHTSQALTAEVSAVERRGLRWAGLTLLVVTAAVLALTLPSGAPLRNSDGGYLPDSPLLSSVTTLVFFAFFVPAIAYGIVVGVIRKGADVPLLMGRALKDLSGFIVLAFVLGQFIALFAWTNIGAWLAVSGAELLQSIGLTGYPAVFGFIVLASVLNLFIISGSSLWTLMASVFVPMFLLIGFEPGFTQAAFRVGDSATQVITPLNPYMIVLLTFVRRYQPSAGLGTLIAKMLPFVVPFWLFWAGVLTVFYFLDLPLGPGMGIHLTG
ncbi:AbgT family transporter [Actinoalloteichus hymeniacidonis]|uniref:p-aminobenzoyl-glutamate transporter n=1 Tax=Actinoalloteichus hymeniacidonis TaxID=340345 RepID=A0AAC9HX57_9PSEU|nr:AbgT family transporter [Actinoalloteichus hymeniacidonis]AOS66110.1 putative p-aminobenzoyl-glutamate transporter [Actinoalloteichus hymeniacidonis]MBB5905786.1 aminobenzoyl-glutamate transport protein [Actinoalloteichus hymeniacidonis]